MKKSRLIGVLLFVASLSQAESQYVSLCRKEDKENAIRYIDYSCVKAMLRALPLSDLLAEGARAQDDFAAGRSNSFFMEAINSVVLERAAK